MKSERYEKMKEQAGKFVMKLAKTLPVEVCMTERKSEPDDDYGEIIYYELTARIENFEETMTVYVNPYSTFEEIRNKALDRAIAMVNEIHGKMIRSEMR